MAGRARDKRDRGGHIQHSAFRVKSKPSKRPCCCRAQCHRPRPTHRITLHWRRPHRAEQPPKSNTESYMISLQPDGQTASRSTLVPMLAALQICRPSMCGTRLAPFFEAGTAGLHHAPHLMLLLLLSTAQENDPPPVAPCRNVTFCICKTAPATTASLHAYQSSVFHTPSIM